MRSPPRLSSALALVFAALGLVTPGCKRDAALEHPAAVETTRSARIARHVAQAGAFGEALGARAQRRIDDLDRRLDDARARLDGPARTCVDDVDGLLRAYEDVILGLDPTQTEGLEILVRLDFALFIGERQLLACEDHAHAGAYTEDLDDPASAAVRGQIQRAQAHRWLGDPRFEDSARASVEGARALPGEAPGSGQLLVDALVELGRALSNADKAAGADSTKDPEEVLEEALALAERLDYSHGRFEAAESLGEHLLYGSAPADETEAQRQARLERGRALHDWVLGTKIEVYGADHPQTGDARLYVAAYHQVQARTASEADQARLLAEALELTREATETYRRKLGWANASSGFGLRSQFYIHIDRGDRDAAFEVIQEALAVELELVGEGHPRSLDVRELLGRELLARQEFEGAAEQLLTVWRGVEALDIDLRISPAWLHQSIGHAFIGLGLNLDALPHYRASVELARSELADAPRGRMIVHENLAAAILDTVEGEGEDPPQETAPDPAPLLADAEAAQREAMAIVQAYADDPEHGPRLLGLDPDDWADEAARALATSRELAAGHTKLARIEVARGDLSKAIQECRRGIELLDESDLAVASFYARIAQIHVRADAIDEAIDAYERAAELDEAHARLMFAATRYQQIGLLERERDNHAGHVAAYAHAYDLGLRHEAEAEPSKDPQERRDYATNLVLLALNLGGTHVFNDDFELGIPYLIEARDRLEALDPPDPGLRSQVLMLISMACEHLPERSRAKTKACPS